MGIFVDQEGYIIITYPAFNPTFIHSWKQRRIHLLEYIQGTHYAILNSNI